MFRCIHWRGREGTISNIQQALELGDGNYKKIETVLRTTYDNIQKKEKYYGLTNWRGGRQNTIKAGSEEEQILADKKQEGCSFTEVTDYINEWRNKYIADYNPEDNVRRSAVINWYRKMSKVVTPINKRCQGNSDPSSNWAKARYRWITQLLIRLGMPPDDLSDFMKDGTLEECFSQDVLSSHKLDIKCIGWWDEVHKSCHIGDKREGATDHVQFPRNAEGKYDPNGHYREDDEERGVVLKVKYPEQARFCFGVAITEDEATGEIAGSRLEAFDYTGQKILSVSDWKQEVDKEIRRVKSLPPGKGLSKWVESDRLDGSAYLDDPLHKLGKKHMGLISGVGTETFKKLKAKNIITVGDAVSLNDDDEKIRGLVTNGLGYDKIKTLTKWCSENAIRQNAPPVTFHHKADNPYKSMYKDDWEDVIAQADELKKKVCITKLVTHVVMETKKTYENTKYKDCWMFYHDALSLMTAKDCVEWMKNQYIDEAKTISYYDKWILPVHGLNDEFSRFKDRPIGNSPEMMPLDNCLNKDLHELVARHVLMSRASALDPNDPRVFSLSSPKKASDAYKRIWSPTSGVGPPSKRIIQDIYKVVEAMKQIFKNKGAFVPDLAQRPGERHITNQLKSKIWGGKRTKKEVLHILFADREDLHKDLKAILAEESARKEGAVVA